MSGKHSDDGLGKDECPFCLTQVQNGIDCLECITCRQRMHSICPHNEGFDPTNEGHLLGMYKFIENRATAKGDRSDIDDMLVCPICSGNEIAYCARPLIDVNKGLKDMIAEQKEAVATKKGGGKKVRKTPKKRQNRNKRTKKSKLRCR